MQPLVTIDKQVVHRYGDIKVAYLVARNIRVMPTPPREKKLARGVEAEIRSRFTLESLQEDTTIETGLGVIL